MKPVCTQCYIGMIYNSKIQKQAKCPSADDWIKKVWYIYTMEYYSAIKKNKILPFATSWIDMGEGIMLCEISQTKKDIHIICMWNIKSKKYEYNKP